MNREIEFECALVGAASFDAAHFSRETFGCTVAVDGGYASLARAGIEPDFALGISIPWNTYPKTLPWNATPP